MAVAFRGYYSSLATVGGALRGVLESRLGKGR
jgi:hypothetical protein